MSKTTPRLRRTPPKEGNLTTPTPPREGNNSPPVEGWQAKPDGAVKLTNEVNQLAMRDTKNYMSLPYNPALKDRARELRRAGNLAEVLLWNQLKRKQFLGLDFDRQKIIGNYIVDFYCAERSVVIEVDGSSHDDKVEYDAIRDAFLMGLDLTVIHLRDRDVKNNMAGVMDFLRGHEVFTTPSLRDTPPDLTTPSLRDTPPREGNLVLSNSPPLEGAGGGSKYESQPDGVMYRGEL